MAIRGTALASLVFVTAVLTVPVAAQDFRPARNRHGQPDFEGLWQVLDPAPHFNIEPHGASYGVPPGLGIVKDPADGRIPYTAAGLAKRKPCCMSAI